MIKGVEEVIPRELEPKIKAILDEFANKLDEAVNFGSHILVWDINPKTNGEENLPPTMLFRHFLDIIDSISILVRVGTGDPPKILARAGLEVMLYLEYLFEKDTEQRCYAFLVDDILRQIKGAKKIHPGTAEGMKMHKVFEQEKVLTELKNRDMTEVEDFLESKERLLNTPKFFKAYQEQQRLKKNGEKNPSWYRYYNGPRNIEQLSSYLKKSTLYEIIYRKWSGSVHGTDIYTGKLSRVNESQTEIVQIRYVKNVQEVVSYSFIMILTVYQLYIDARIPEKKSQFIKWYQTIRDFYMAITTRNFIVVS